MIRLGFPSIEDDDLEAVRAVLISGYLVQARNVSAFEKAVAQLTGCAHAVAVSSGTAALHLALLALEIQPKDIILTTAFSWPAAANVAELCGAEPIFADICPDTFNIDPASLDSALRRLMDDTTTAGRVKAIVPIHAFGQLAQMPAILEIADRYSLPVIEDAACALGASLSGRQAGSWGTLGCFSFHPRKAVTTGEGGVVTTNDGTLARRLRMLRNHGLDPDAESPDFVAAGFNYRMTDFQGALGMTQMMKLQRVINARRRLAERYDKLLADTAIRPPVVANNHIPVFQSYVALLPEHVAARRSTVIRMLREREIETTIGTWHVPLTTYFRSTRGYKEGDFPVTDSVFARSLSLPLHEQLTQDDQDRVISHLLDVLKNAG